VAQPHGDGALGTALRVGLDLGSPPNFSVDTSSDSWYGLFIGSTGSSAMKFATNVKLVEGSSIDELLDTFVRPTKIFVMIDPNDSPRVITLISEDKSELVFYCVCNDLPFVDDAIFEMATLN
jgi:hypothetical protein